MRGKPYVAGALALAGFQLFLAGAVLRFVPTTALIAPVARVLDSLAPWLLGAALLICILLFAMKCKRLGAALTLMTLVAVAQLYVEHRTYSVPIASDQTPDLRILFFNAQRDTDTPSADIVKAVLAQDPDILVIAERAAVDPSIAMILRAYPFVTPCEEEACELLIASKVAPKRFWQLNLNPAWGKRYAVAEFATGDDTSVFLAANQIAKPWLSGLSETELGLLSAQYNWFQGDVIAVGDFNAAPWSFPMRHLMQKTGMRGVRVPPATWPASAGGFGLPIDQILVRGDVQVTGVSPFGGGLGSNHRGIVAEISLP